MPELKFIGIANTPFKTIENMPLQGSGLSDAEGVLEINKEYEEGLVDLEGFSHCYVLFYLHKSGDYKLMVTPFLDKKPHGLFATRVPCRPNQIGLSIVRIRKREGNKLFVSEIDLLDGTPILDIKPYISQFDEIKSERNGWYDMTGNDHKKVKSDDRFKS